MRVRLQISDSFVDILRYWGLSWCQYELTVSIITTVLDYTTTRNFARMHHRKVKFR